MDAEGVRKALDRYSAGQVLTSDGTDLKWDNSSNSYELVTDLDLWKFELPVERFISKDTQRF